MIAGKKKNPSSIPPLETEEIKKSNIMMKYARPLIREKANPPYFVLKSFFVLNIKVLRIKYFVILYHKSGFSARGIFYVLAIMKKDIFCRKIINHVFLCRKMLVKISKNILTMEEIDGIIDLNLNSGGIA